MAPRLSGDGEQDMKGILHIWKRQTFARQLTMVFMGVFLFQMVIVQGLSSSYMRRFMKEKIEESYQNSLRQTTLNLDTSLKGYKKADVYKRQVSGAVLPAATAMAAACYGCAQCIGQFISPVVLNAVSFAVFKSVTTTHVYVLSLIHIFFCKEYPVYLVKFCQGGRVPGIQVITLAVFGYNPDVRMV